MITTTVTWADLKNAHNTELEELRDAYEEIVDLATDRYGEDAMDRHLSADPDLLSEDERDLYVYQQQAAQYDQAAKSIQQRRAILETLQEEYGDGEFEIKMLTGEETMDIETQLRMDAQQQGVDVSVIQAKRNGLTVDRATVDAPEGIPRDSEGEPKPSDAPNALTLSLWEQIEKFNNAGTPDFRAEGFGDHDPVASPTHAQSATPTASSGQSSHSDRTESE